MIKQTIDLPADLMSRLTRAAQLTGVPEAEIVRTALRDWLAGQRLPSPPTGTATDARPFHPGPRTEIHDT